MEIVLKGPQGQRAVAHSDKVHKRLLAAGYVAEEDAGAGKSAAPQTAAPPAPAKSLEDMTLQELQEKAVAMNLDVPAKSSRARVIEVINSAEAKTKQGEVKTLGGAKTTP